MAISILCRQSKRASVSDSARAGGSFIGPRQHSPLLSGGCALSAAQIKTCPFEEMRKCLGFIEHDLETSLKHIKKKLDFWRQVESLANGRVVLVRGAFSYKLLDMEVEP